MDFQQFRPTFLINSILVITIINFIQNFTVVFHRMCTLAVGLGLLGTVTITELDRSIRIQHLK